MESSPASPTSSLGNCAEDYARRKPAQAVATAFGAGLLLNMLPLGAITAALVAVALTLVRPALLFLGLLKVCELCGANTSRPVSSQSQPH